MNRATSGWTKPQPALEPPRPVSRMTAGAPFPVHHRCSLYLRCRRDVREAESPPGPFESQAIVRGAGECGNDKERAQHDENAHRPAPHVDSSRQIVRSADSLT